uniref:Mitochondrial carrier protein n=1 Tax=Lotharella globosa TaxID=91324 RepID=A0A7S3Z9W2_9EUKA|mmetsp:Transcript_19516/g.39505  ORF Transcript_19516/g.39505 Transcript_19516/m.39505 type:complete len:341 (+) Transcript_19516:53-1075(+)
MPKPGSPRNNVSLTARWARPLAGSASALVEIAALQPLDVVKTRSQLGYKVKKPMLGSKLVGLPFQVAKEEGSRALYKGMGPLMSQQSIKYATRHGMFQAARNLLWGSPEARGVPAPAHINLLSGLLAGMTESVVVTTPFEVVKIRLQKEKGFGKVRPSTIQTAINIVSQEGIAALWKGVVPTMLRGGTNQACNFYAATAINQHVWGRREGDGKQIAVWKSMTTGFIAGCIGPTLNNPLDVAKTRLMAQEGSSSSVRRQPAMTYGLRPQGACAHHQLARTLSTSTAEPKYTGMIDCIRKVAANEGLPALWSGIAPRLIRTGLGQAISWTIVTRVMAHVEKA